MYLGASCVERFYVFLTLHAKLSCLNYQISKHENFTHRNVRIMLIKVEHDINVEIRLSVACETLMIMSYF